MVNAMGTDEIQNSGIGNQNPAMYISLGLRAVKRVLKSESSYFLESKSLTAIPVYNNCRLIVALGLGHPQDESSLFFGEMADV